MELVNEHLAAIEGGAGPAAAADVQLHRRSQPSGHPRRTGSWRSRRRLSAFPRHGARSRRGSEAATEEIRTLVERSRATLEAFSEASKEALREARARRGGPWRFCARRQSARIAGAGDSGGDARVAGENRGDWRHGGIAWWFAFSGWTRPLERNRGSAPARGGRGRRRGRGRSMRKRWSGVSRRTTRQRWSARFCGRRSKEGRCRWRSRISPATAWSFFSHRALGLGRESSILEQPIPFREDAALMTFESGEMPGFSDEGDIGSQ